MTTNVPKFVSLPDWEGSTHPMADFGIEMFRCTDSNRIRSKYVNILGSGKF